MTVYKPKNSKHYHYDFQFKGIRYHGSTGCQAKRDAERYERDRRTEAALGTKVKPSLTMDEAMGIFWEQKAKHDKDGTIEGQLARLVAMIGPKKLLADITQHDMNVFVATRRGMKARRKETLVSAATVNREIEAMRRACAYLEDGYSVPAINWSKLKLPEPNGRVRELTDAEQAALFEQLPEDLSALAMFAMLSGQRRTAITTLTWSNVDLANRSARVLTKGGIWHRFPLSPQMIAILANRPKACPQVFTYECERSAPAKQGNPPRVKGHRYPFSEDGWKRKWAAALKRAGISDFRFHDLRHTAATRVTRNSGIHAAQRLLGHTDIKTTSRYSHVRDDDLLAAMIAAESRIIPGAGKVVALKPAEKRQK